MGRTACMAQLGQDGDLVLMDGGGDPFQSVQIRPFIKSNLMDTGPAFRRDEAVFLDQETGPALGHISIIIHKGLGHLAFVRFFRSHGRQHQTVLQGQGTQRDGLVEQGMVHEIAPPVIILYTIAIIQGSRRKSKGLLHGQQTLAVGSGHRESVQQIDFGLE